MDNVWVKKVPPILRITTTTLFYCVAILGLVISTTLVVFNITGIVTVTSAPTNSMSPHIHAGSLVFAEPLKSRGTTPKPGDVVVISTSGTTLNGETTIGRVTDVTKEKNGVSAYTIQPDNRVLPDEWAYKVSDEAVSVELFSIPLLGFIFNLVSTVNKTILFTTIILTLGFVWFFGLLRKPTPNNQKQEEVVGDAVNNHTITGEFLTVEGNLWRRTMTRLHNTRMRKRLNIVDKGADVLQDVFYNLGEPVTIHKKYGKKERSQAKKEGDKLPRKVTETIPPDKELESTKQ